MKKKVNGLGVNISLLIFCFGILLACPVRLVLMLRNIEPSTGFYANSKNPLIFVLYIALVLVGLCLMIFPKISKRTPPPLELTEKNIPLACFSLLFAVGLVEEAIVNLTSSSMQTTILVQSVKTVSIMSKVETVFAFISAIYFIILFACFLFGSSMYKKLSILPLAPLCWSIFSIMSRLILIINYTRISELFLEMVALVFVMIFLLSFARIISNTNPDKAMGNLIGSGLTAALLIFTYTIPRLVLTIMGKSSLLTSGYPVRYSHLALAVFIVVYIIVLLTKGTPIKSSEQDEETEKTTVTVIEKNVEDDEGKDETETAASETVQAPQYDEQGNIIFKK